MNHDDHHPQEQGQIPDELEARVVAWVAGEAGAAEAAELEKLAAQRPEVAALKARIEATCRLVSESVAPDKEALRLSRERRAELLRTLRKPARPGAEPGSPSYPAFEVLRRRWAVQRGWIFAVAACLTVGAFLAVRFAGDFGAAASFRKAEVAKAAPAAMNVATETEGEPGNEVSRQLSGPAKLDDERARLHGAQAGAPGIVRSAGAAEQKKAFQEQQAELAGKISDLGRDKSSYRVNSTLAGARVRTDLKDVASAVSVVTTQGLQETGARNAEAGVANAPAAEAENRDIQGKGAKPAGAGGSVAQPESDAETVARARPEVPAGPGETSAAKDPFSTFSMHVSDASFVLAQGALERGEAPDPAGIRPEEFYNAVNYGDPAPSMAEKISCRTEQSADPTMQQRNLLRIAMAVPATGRAAQQALRLTVLLDTSGSMEREDRAASVRRAMETLVSLLRAEDRVTLVGFARQPRLLADQVPGDRAAALLDIVKRTPAQGGTNMEEAIKLGGELASRQYAAGAQNRIVLLTDGAANLGDADPEHLAARVEALRQKGCAFDACGVGTNGIDDAILEALTRKGAGRYYVLNTPEAADAGFARQLAGALHPAAENVKVQVRFNPSRVGNYRLVGFEQHRLRKEDFHNDAVVAAALAAGEAAVALYEVQPLPQGEGELGEVYVRFRDTASGAMVERSWTLPYDPSAPAFDRATPTMQLAGTAAFLAEKLRGGARADAIRLSQLAPVVNALRSHYAHDARVQQLVAMYERMRHLRME